MFVKNIDISNFGASVSKKLIQTTTIEIEKERFKNNFNQISSKQKFKNIAIRILFQAETRDLAYKNISNFMTKIVDETEIKFKNLAHYYYVFLTDSNIDDTEFDEWLYLNLTFEGYEYSDEVTETMNRITSKTINVLGNIETPVIVEITPSVELIDIVLTGFDKDIITISNLVGNKKIILDGENCTVTVDGVNKFADTKMWDFPNFKPGSNTITSTRSNCDITIKYKPRFI